MENPTLNEHHAWAKIATADNQADSYFGWCRRVLVAQAANQLTVSEAASMMAPRQGMAPFGGLEQSPDVQLAMDYAADISSGSAYAGAEDNLQRDWVNYREPFNDIFELCQPH